VLGETEPGCSVKADDKSMSVDSEGRFTGRLYLREGKNRFVFASRDGSGNEVKTERVVYRLLPGQKGKFQKAQRPEEEKEEEGRAKSGALTSIAVGLLTIGTIVAIFLLIIQ